MIPQVEPQFVHDLNPMAVAAFFVRADSERIDSDLTPMKLHKLMYLAQANYLASTDRRLFSADVEAFDHGPVIDAIRSEFNGRKIISPEEHAQVVRMPVPADVDAFLSRIWELYGDWSAAQLWRLTHKQDPWRQHYEQGRMHTVIPDEAMAEYFRQKVPLKQRVLHPEVVVVDVAVLDELEENEDTIVARALAAFR